MHALCEKYDLPYTTGSLGKQYLLALRTIHKLSLPDQWLRATSDNAPETSSERRFRSGEASTVHALRIDPLTGKRRGLRSAIAEARVSLRNAKKEAKRQAKLMRQAQRNRVKSVTPTQS